MDTAAILSASAATVAAGLAGANLVVSGRRETRRWWREVLIEVFGGYLDASYRIDAACRDVSRAPRDHPLEYESARHRYDEEVQDAHSAQLQYLTRLRLLASPEAVHAARTLRKAGHRLRDVASAATEPDPGEVSDARKEHAAALNELLIAARRMIAVRGSTGHVGMR